MITAIHKALAAKRDAIKNNEDQGFTLIELLVVVLIIGVLAAIAIPVYLGVQSTAKDNAIKADLTNIKTAVVAYQTQNGGNLPSGLTVAQLGGTVSIDAQNYASGGTPAITVSGTGAAATFSVCATGNNGNSWRVTATSAPVSVTSCS